MKESLRRDESGLALIAVLLAMALLTVIGAGLTAVGIVELRASTNHRSATRALMLADAGAAHALALMRGPLAEYTYGDVLVGGDGIPDTEDDGLFVGFGLAVEEELPDSGVPLGEGRYYVQVINDPMDPSGDPLVDANDRFVALCRGETRDGGVAEVRVLLTSPNFPAVATNGDLLLPGEPSVVGPCAGVHANRVVGVDGHPIVDGSVTYSDSIIMDGVIYDLDGNVVEPRYEPPMEVPELEPSDYCGGADYVLHDGYLVSTGPPRDSSNVTGLRVMGWEWDPSQNLYKLKGSDAVPGTVCADGNIEVTGNLGSAGAPLSVTLIAEGSVKIGGTPYIESDHAEEILILAGGDVQIGGNPTATGLYDGLIYAGSQCKVNGTPTVQGHLLCYDDEDPFEAIDLTDENKVNGTPTISYDCSGMRRRTLVGSWWESRTS